MKGYIIRRSSLLKGLIICGVVLLTATCEFLLPAFESAEAEFDLKAAILISMGFGAAIRLLRWNGKN